VSAQPALSADPLTAFMGRQTSPSRALLKIRRNVVRTFLADVPDFLAATDDDVGGVAERQTPRPVNAEHVPRARPRVLQVGS